MNKTRLKVRSAIPYLWMFISLGIALIALWRDSQYWAAITLCFGFLIYLSIVLLSDVRWRSLLVALLAVPILTVGVARVYDGAHWPSDVLGGYLIGGIWLGLTIQIYRWAKAWFAGSYLEAISSSSSALASSLAARCFSATS